MALIAGRTKAVACFLMWTCSVAASFSNTNPNSVEESARNERPVLNEGASFLQNPAGLPERTTEQQGHVTQTPLLGISYPILILIRTPMGPVILHLETLSVNRIQALHNEHRLRTQPPWPMQSRWPPQPAWPPQPRTVFGDAQCTIKTYRSGGTQMSTCDCHIIRRSVFRDHTFHLLAMQLERLGYTNVSHYYDHAANEMGDAFTWKFDDCRGRFGIEIHICYFSSLRFL